MVLPDPLHPGQVAWSMTRRQLDHEDQIRQLFRLVHLRLAAMLEELSQHPRPVVSPCGTLALSLVATLSLRPDGMPPDAT